jgi:hypothetical protein
MPTAARMMRRWLYRTRSGQTPEHEWLTTTRFLFE